MNNTYKTIIKLYFSILIINNLFCYNKYEVDYLIICADGSCDSAEAISNIYNYEISEDKQLNTTVIDINDINSQNDSLDFQIRDFLIEFTNLKFLLLFGTYESIPPIENNSIPSDDYYTSDNINYNLHESFTNVSTGRIPFNDTKNSELYVDKLKKYIFESNSGSWKSKILLISDDQYKNGEYKKIEYSHTENSDRLFNILNSNFNVYQLYGINYSAYFNGTSYIHNNLNNDIINHINSGNLIINYIGHGNSTSWSEEKIFDKSRDIPRINAPNESIWIAGTCGFGQYYDENNIVKDLLIKDGAAIAVISTVDDISYTDNKIFLENLFYNIKENSLDNDYRLAEIFNSSKRYYCAENNQNQENCSGIWSADGYCRTDSFEDCYDTSNWLANDNPEKLFHYFGDPALIVPIPKISNDLITYNDTATIIEKNDIQVNSDSDSIFSYIEITSNNFEKINYTQNDSLIYNWRGDYYFNSEFVDKNICFRIPIDAIGCDSCKLYINYFQEDSEGNVFFQKLTDINIDTSIYISNDFDGPKISIYQNEHKLNNGSSIIDEQPLQIYISDEIGINISESNNHMIKYWIDDKNKTSVSGNLFTYSSDCESGSFSVVLPTEELMNSNVTFNIEARDNYNNITQESYILNNVTNKNTKLFSNVYNFPNPFSKETYITLLLNETPVNISIDIYSISGNHILSEQIDDYNEEYFVFKWNTRNLIDDSIPSGVYVYRITATSKATGETLTEYSKAVKILNSNVD